MELTLAETSIKISLLPSILQFKTWLTDSTAWEESLGKNEQAFS